MAEFDYTFEYKPGKANVVADQLSRKTALTATVSSNCITIVDKIREGMHHDPVSKQLLILSHQGKRKKFWEGGLLYTAGRRVYVPKWANLRHRLIKEEHDTVWAGHP